MKNFIGYVEGLEETITSIINAQMTRIQSELTAGSACSTASGGPSYTYTSMLREVSRKGYQDLGVESKHLESGSAGGVDSSVTGSEIMQVSVADGSDYMPYDVEYFSPPALPIADNNLGAISDEDARSAVRSLLESTDSISTVPLHHLHPMPSSFLRSQAIPALSNEFNPVHVPAVGN